MLPYAESMLTKAETNQWFVGFYVPTTGMTSEQQAQLNWFASQGLELTEVRTHAFDAPVTYFYHVSFAGDQDVRLKAYSEQFEDDQGVSLHPELYQLYEWSYSAWCANGLQAAWKSHMENVA